MKILHLYKDYHPVLGGIENIVKWLAESQAKAGHEVTVLVASLTGQTTQETLNGVTVHKIGRLTTIASTPITPTLPLALSQYQPDIAHVHSPYPPGELLNWLLGRARFTVITYHSDVVRQQTILQFYRPFLKKVLQHADIIMPTSANYIDSSLFLQPHKDKCRVVPLGIDVSHFNVPNLPLAQNLRAPFGTPLLLFVGRLRYYKGLNTLIDAMRYIPQAKLLIVGHGPLKSELENQVNIAGLNQRVHFAGDVNDDELLAYFQAADVFVLPSNSRAEAFGIVLLEAMASGLPCVATELGTGTSWIVQHGVTGLVVPPETPELMAAAINIIITNEPLRQQLGQAARQRVETMFTKTVMTQRVLEVYNELLNSKKKQ